MNTNSRNDVPLTWRGIYERDKSSVMASVQRDINYAREFIELDDDELVDAYSGMEFTVTSGLALLDLPRSSELVALCASQISRASDTVKKQALYNITRIVSILFSLFILLLTTSAAEASSVTLRWDPISGSSDGYRVFARESGQGYNYSQHAWQGSASTCTVNNLQDQTEYYFVVRAFDGSITSTNSNEVHYVPPAANTPAPVPTNGVLGSKFAETTLTGGVEYYTDRSYQLTGVPSSYDNMDAIITPNDDRNRTDASGYVTFTMPYAGTVYVAFDSRATSLPNWMNGFVNTGDVLRTSLSSQPSLRYIVEVIPAGRLSTLAATRRPGLLGVLSAIISYFTVILILQPPPPARTRQHPARTYQRHPGLVWLI